MRSVFLTKTQQWLLLFLILLPLLLLFLIPWQWRWRLFAYLPYILLFGHFALLVLSLRDGKYWGLFKAYFFVPIVIHCVYGLKSVFAFFIVSPLAGGPIVLLGILMAPYLSFQNVEHRIEKQEDALYLDALKSGKVDYHELLEVNRPLTYVEQGFLLRRTRASDSFTEEELNRWVQRYATEWNPPEQSALRNLLMDPAIHPEVLLEFAKNHPNNYNLVTIAKNPNTPLQAIEICARSEDFKIQYAAIRSKRLSREKAESILWEMIREDSSAAKRYVLEAPQATAPMLDQYIDLGSTHTSLIVRHPAVTEAQLMQIAKHETFWIRKLVAEHPRVSMQVLEELAQDSNPEVAEVAKNKLR